MDISYLARSLPGQSLRPTPKGINAPVAGL